MSQLSLKDFSFVKVSPKTKAAFCVDGRVGTVGGKRYAPYPQFLGGGLGFAVLNWLVSWPDDNLLINIEIVFNRLKQKGYPLGVHTSTHAHPSEDKSDCGFADNLPKIIETFLEENEVISRRLNSAISYFDRSLWVQLTDRIKPMEWENIAAGQRLISRAVDQGAILQTLIGDHQEAAAIVNLKDNTTLDVNKSQKHSAFNLDLWLVDLVGKDLGWPIDRVKLLTLGLYLATEIVLVEQKDKPKLPILVRK